MSITATTKPYLLSHVRPSPAAQRAAAQATASLPAPLRLIADFYSSLDTCRRQEALDDLLQLLQEPLQQQYTGMWGSDAISVFVIKVRSNSVVSCRLQRLACRTMVHMTVLMLLSLAPLLSHSLHHVCHDSDDTNNHDDSNSLKTRQQHQQQ